VEPYSEENYAWLQTVAQIAARIFVPSLADLLFSEHGDRDVAGVDGDNISRWMLAIPEEHSLPYNRERSLRMDRRFDSVASLRHSNLEHERDLWRCIPLSVRHPEMDLISRAVAQWRVAGLRGGAKAIGGMG
jgi:hypothetical protein